MRMWKICVFVMLLSGCAAMQEAQEQRLDQAVSLTQGAQLGRYRQIFVDRLYCRSAECPPIDMLGLTATLEKGLTDACYSVIPSDQYQRYASHFEERLNRPGRRVSIRGPQGGLLVFQKLDSELRSTLADELQLDGIVTGWLEVGPPDTITAFSPYVYHARLMESRGRKVIWSAQISGNILGDDSAMEDLHRGMNDLVTAIGRKASLCSLPVPEPEQYEGIALVAQEIRLRERIYFELNSAELSRRSYGILTRLSKYLIAHSELGRLRVEGHTDDYGEEGYNLTLSQARADAVRQFLIRQGVSEHRLVAKGFGEERPLVPNTTEINRARNRRVEFRLIAQKRH